MTPTYYGAKRSLVLVFILSFLTCGIYSMIWFYQVTKELNEYNEDYRTNPGLALVLMIITCGLYTFYWWYRMNQLMMEAQSKTNYKLVTDNKVLYLLLNLFGLSIINMLILQSDLNTLWERATQVQVTQPVPPTRPSKEDDEWTDY